MIHRSLFLVFALLAPAAAAQPSGPSGGLPSPHATRLTDEQRTKGLYVLGVMIARRTPLAKAKLTPAELEEVLKSFTATALHEAPAVDLDKALPKADRLIAERQQAAAGTEKAAGARLLAEAAARQGALTLPSGAVMIEKQAGAGPAPVATSRVRVHYQGTLADGTEFDSSFRRGRPSEFTLDNVIPCWKEALQQMKVGGSAELVCPSSTAYGDKGRPPTIPPGAVLAFEVELLDIVTEEEP